MNGTATKLVSYIDGADKKNEMFKIFDSDGILVKRTLLMTDSKAVPGFKEKLWSEELL